MYGASSPPDIANTAVSGETLLQMQAEIAAEMTPRFAASRATKKVLLLWGGANDIGAGVSAATTWQRYQDYVTAFKAANPGIPIIGFTLIDIKDGINPSVTDAKRAEFNGLLLASVGTVVSAVVDGASAAQLQDPTDLTYWNVDGVHLNNTGCGVIAALAKPIVDAL